MVEASVNLSESSFNLSRRPESECVCMAGLRGCTHTQGASCCDGSETQLEQVKLKKIELEASEKPFSLEKNVNNYFERARENTQEVS